MMKPPDVLYDVQNLNAQITTAFAAGAQKNSRLFQPAVFY